MEGLPNPKPGALPGLPEASEASETWKYTTMERLEAAMRERESNEITESYNNWKKATAEELVEAIAVAVGSTERSRLKAGMEKLLKDAFLLAIHLGKQRCRMEFFYLTPGTVLQESDLRAIKNRDRKVTETNAGSTIALAISPGLKRFGDSRGGFSSKDSSVVCQAEVFLHRS